MNKKVKSIIALALILALASGVYQHSQIESISYTYFDNTQTAIIYINNQPFLKGTQTYINEDITTFEEIIEFTPYTDITLTEEDLKWTYHLVLGTENITSLNILIKHPYDSDFKPFTDTTLLSNNIYQIKVTATKKVERGNFSIYLAPIIKGIEITEFTWWNGSWNNKRVVNINNTAGSALSYYQVYVDLSSTPINATSLRVVNETSDTTQPQWCENVTGGYCYALWYNATSVPASLWLNDTHYIYYTNPSASNTSNGTTTFPFFDNFESVLRVEDWYLEQVEPYFWKGDSGFDVSGTEQPFPYYNEADGLYYLFYEACDGTSGLKYKIGVATSTNATGPFTRSEFNPVIDVIGKEGEAGSSGTNGPSVIKVGSIYYMFVGHQDSSGIWDSIRRYNSTDLINWTNNGTALSPSAGEWDSGYIASPTVIYDPETVEYLMVYEACVGTTSEFQVGLATATNITDTFTKSENNPIIDTNTIEGRKWPGNPCIIKRNDLYNVYWYAHAQSGIYKGFYYSTSPDLINWTHVPGPTYVATGSCCATSVHVFNDSSTYLLFHARRNITDTLYEVSIAFEGETESIEGDTTDWTTNSGSPTTASGLGGTPYSLRFPTLSTSDFTTSANFPDEYSSFVYESLFKIDSDFLELRFGLQSSNLYIENFWSVYMHAGINVIQIKGYNGSWHTLSNVTWSGALGTEYNLSIIKNGSYVTTYINGVKYNDNVDLGALNFNTGKTCVGSAGQANIDNIRVRKYTSHEPTTSIGTEESSATLTTSNIQNYKYDWGISFNSNFSANVTVTTASNVFMNFTHSDFTNTSLGTLSVGTDEWVNESHTISSPVTNISVTVTLTSTTSGATNDSDTFYYEITKRSLTSTMDSSSTQTANITESFYINATATDEHSDTFYGAADLLEDGTIISTNSTVTDYVNFSHSESASGTYNYTIRFYNLTHYTNATSPTYSNVTVADTLTLTAYSNEYIIINNWTSDQTFLQIDTNLTNDYYYSYYNGTEYLSYMSGYNFNNDTTIPKNESIMISFTSDTTLTNHIQVVDITIIGARWFYTFLPDYTSKTLSTIYTSMASDGGDVWELYGWDNSSSSYNNSDSFTVNPNEGIIVYANATFVWTNT